MRIHIHANCQGTPFRKILQEIYPDFHVTNREVHAIKLDQDMPAYEEEIRQADIIVSQPVGDTYRGEPRLSNTWMAENKKPSARIIRMVPLYFKAYHPAMGYNRPLDSFRMPYVDFDLLGLYLDGKVGREISDILFDPDFYSRTYLESVRDASIRELARREQKAQVEIKVSDLIADHYRQKLLFFTFNHPARAMSVMVVRRALEVLGLTEAVPDVGPEYLHGTVVGPCASVRANLDLQFDDYSDKVVVPGAEFAAPDYVDEVVAYFDRIGRDAVTQAAAANEAFAAYRQSRAEHATAA